MVFFFFVLFWLNIEKWNKNNQTNSKWKKKTTESRVYENIQAYKWSIADKAREKIGGEIKTSNELEIIQYTLKHAHTYVYISSMNDALARL